jgi:hypothetical protein
MHLALLKFLTLLRNPKWNLIWKKTRDDMAIMFKILMFDMMEFKILREWIATTVCPQINVTAPPRNPSPAIDPPSENSTSSDDSSPTNPK